MNTHDEDGYIHTPFGMFPAAGPEPGDVVALITGSLPMTVEDYCPDCGTVYTVWFDGDGERGWVLHRDEFPAVCLVLLTDDDEDDIGPCAGSC